MEKSRSVSLALRREAAEAHLRPMHVQVAPVASETGVFGADAPVLR